MGTEYHFFYLQKYNVILLYGYTLEEKGREGKGRDGTRRDADAFTRRRRRRIASVALLCFDLSGTTNKSTTLLITK